MGIEIQVINLIQIGNSLEVSLFPKQNARAEPHEMVSPEYVINGATVFQVMMIKMGNYLQYLVKFTKKCAADELTYTMKYSHKTDKTPNESVNKIFTTDDGTWRVVDLFQGGQLKTFHVALEVSVAVSSNTCASLHDDNELTDFELRGDDGSVRLHKAVASACSPVFKTMFSGEWRESKEGVVNVPNTSRATLQRFKDYMYLGTVPDEYLGELLLLASYYMMPDLQRRCEYELLAHLTSETAYETIRFAVKHNMSQLLFHILDRVQSKELDVDKMREQEKGAENNSS